MSRSTLRRAFAAACALSLLAPLASPRSAAASADIAVAPVVIDLKAKARDLVNETITVENRSARLQRLYGWVNNVTGGDGGGVQAFEDAAHADKRVSLANWLSFTRGVIDLPPHATQQIPITVAVPPDALPGTYHAVIYFAPGSNRDDAQANPAAGASAMVNIEVTEKVVEFMQLTRFVPASVFSGGAQAAFAYELQNIGNRPLVPRGDIIIYDRRGKEVGSVAVNPDQEEVAAGATKDFTSAWTPDVGLGRYKAYFNGSYGDSQAANLTDAAFFYVLPWRTLLAIFLTCAVLVVIAASLWHRRVVMRRGYALAEPEAVADDPRTLRVGPTPRIAPRDAEHISVLDLRPPPR